MIVRRNQRDDVAVVRQGCIISSVLLRGVDHVGVERADEVRLLHLMMMGGRHQGDTRTGCEN